MRRKAQGTEHAPGKGEKEKKKTFSYTTGRYRVLLSESENVYLLPCNT